MCATDDLLWTEEPTWQERVIQERVEIEYAIRRLNQFIYSEEFDILRDFEQELLQEQRAAMETYYQILGERICCFKV